MQLKPFWSLYLPSGQSEEGKEIDILRWLKNGVNFHWEFHWELNVFYRHLIHTLICLSRGEDLKRQGIAYAYPNISPIFL